MWNVMKMITKTLFEAVLGTVFIVLMVLIVWFFGTL